MIPPFVRRCPDCGYVSLRRRFATVEGATGRPRVECPRCGHRFETVDNPVYN